MKVSIEDILKRLGRIERDMRNVKVEDRKGFIQAVRKMRASVQQMKGEK